MRKGRSKRSVGGKVRPTTQKILESLSSILQPRLEDSQVLDLFAGTGRVGMRLAELGARSVVFVEGNRKVAQELRGALREQAMEGVEFSLVQGAIPQVLSKVRGRYSVVVCDPPYDWDQPAALLPSALELVEPGGILVVEHHHKTAYEPVPGWDLWRREKFGETRLSFFERLPVHGPDHYADDQKDT